MTLRHIRIFLGVCDQGFHITRAAETLHMTQPAVSLAIRELEEYYGVRLFDRIGRRLQITETGKRFQEYAVRIAGLFDDMERSLRNGDAFGVLRVGASVTIGTKFLPGYVREFSERFPGVDVRVTVEASERLEQKIMGNALDLALIEGAAHEPSLVSEPYMEDRLAVICGAGGPFAPGQRLSRETFCGQRLLLRERGSGTREEFERATAQAGISITPAWETTSNTALMNAAIGGLGLAVLSRRLAAGPLERGEAVEVYVEGLDFRRQFRIIRHKDKFLTDSARAFMEICRADGTARG